MDILYRDGYLVAINKPHGLLVHRSTIAADASEFAVQLLRDQIGRRVFPVHRLDRKTGGVLLFALDKETEILMQAQFAQRKIDKTYIALVRGYAADQGTIDYPLRKENGALQEAITTYSTLFHGELNIPLGKHPTSRYSLIKATPLTGRMHQIRKHFAHIHHPIIGDRPHGCNKQNKFFKETWLMDTMMLHAAGLSFKHPVTQIQICIQGPLQPEFMRMTDLMQWKVPDII